MRDEFEILGIPFAERGAITDETLAVLRVLFEDEGPFEGRYFRFPAVDFHPKPRARPFPIYVGSGCNTRSLRRVARYAQGWTPIGVDLKEFEQALPELAALMDEQGRSMGSLDLQGTLKAPEPGGPGEETFVRRIEDMTEAGFTSLVIDIGVLTTPDMDTAERHLRWVSESLRIVP